MSIPTVPFLNSNYDGSFIAGMILPKTEKYDAVHYVLGEWDALMNNYHTVNLGLLPREAGQSHCYPIPQ